MRKNNYVKQDGKLPDGIPFKKGDIVTYYKAENGKVKEREVILLEKIEEGRQLDIFGQAMLITKKGWDNVTTDPFSASRVWHNGGHLRYANFYEMRAFINALVKKCQGV